MLFIVIERFRDRDAKAVYRRFRDEGRGAPVVPSAATREALEPLL